MPTPVSPAMRADSIAPRPPGVGAAAASAALARYTAPMTTRLGPVANALIEAASATM